MQVSCWARLGTVDSKVHATIRPVIFAVIGGPPMIRSFLRTAIGAALAIALQAKPAIYIHSVVNGASYYAPGLPGGSIAEGSLFSIFGSRLGPSQAATRAEEHTSELQSL